jgi:hypothetical protein
VPRFGRAPIAAIDYPMVATFVSDLQRAGVGAGTVRNIRDVLRLIGASRRVTADRQLADLGRAFNSNVVGPSWLLDRLVD